MFNLNKNTIERLTPAKAAQYLEKNRFPRQRKLKRPRIDALTKEYKRGRYVHQHVAIAFAKLPDGTKWLVDGQHRLTFMLETGVSLDMCVHEYHVKDMAEAARLYNSFDPLGSARSRRDNARAHGLDELDLKAGYRTPGYKAAEAILKGCQFDPLKASVHPDAEEAVATTKEFIPEINTYMEILKQCAKENGKSEIYSQLKTTGIMTVALVTLQNQPEYAKRFWENVALRNPTNRFSGEEAKSCQYFVEWMVKPVKDYVLGPTVHLHTATATSHYWNIAYTGGKVKKYYKPSDKQWKALNERSKTTPVHLDGCNI